ncbi:hypothetical protein K458DRAFT_308528 [Lentithecium fluviatile CBS 122367]|uniref:Uncharacterized protein n=1 Tax=Lentithecium fluviatile CBS 122367 TaxID=1168545 RepID=A0A6G1IVD6_9PLEO|nr:hypothetical protein K458DRAFT_308528 [Lentithecium fluviatile CBS 122367]
MNKLQFNLTDHDIQGLLPRNKEAAPRDFIEETGDFINDLTSAAGPAASQVVSAAKSFTSEVPELVTKVQSAVTSAATGLEGTLLEFVPQNLSLGTTQFCVGFINSKDCKGLPLNLSDILPGSLQDLPISIRNVVQDSVDSLQPVATALTNIAYVRVSLIVGIVFVWLFAIWFIASTLEKVLCIVGIFIGLGRRSRIVVYTVLGVVYCAPLAIATAFLVLLKSKVDTLPSWIKVEHGEVGGLCLGALCCAAVLTIITAASPAFVH